MVKVAEKHAQPKITYVKFTLKRFLLFNLIKCSVLPKTKYFKNYFRYD